MKRIRIACSSGGCPYERMEPAFEVLEHGNLDYIVFECLAERTIVAAQMERVQDPSKGYNGMLEERMRAFLPLLMEKRVKLVSNMGGANPAAAVARIAEIAREMNISGLTIAMVNGDDVMPKIASYMDRPLWDAPGTLRDLKDQVIAANAYLSGDPIAKALDLGADIVITGRVADPALFVGILKHEYGWSAQTPDKLGQALLLGHLLECGSQLTGGYYADPGFKEVPDLHRLGHPIAEIDETGEFSITKVKGSGGLIDTRVCKEQLLYEIGDPGHYITPDGIADFSKVRFRQAAPDVVIASGATSKGEPDHYKVNVGYRNGFVGEGAISFGGATSLARAKLAADVVQKRWEIIGVKPHLDEVRVEYIGYNSLFRDSISEKVSSGPFSEIRLRIAVRTKDKATAQKAIREVDCLYINGPAGGGGISSKVANITSIENILIPRADLSPRVTLTEVRGDKE